MSRLVTPYRAFLAVTGLFIITTLVVPTRLLGWVNDVAAIVALPTVPFGDLGTSARAWLLARDEGMHDADNIDHIRRELDRYRVLYHGELQRNRTLAELLAGYEQARELGGGVDFQPVAARITGQNTAGKAETYRLNVGSRRGVVPGTVAVYHGSHLIGRVSDVSPLTSLLVPMTEEAAGFVQAMVATERSSADRPVVTLLRGTNRGTLVGEVDADSGIQMNDIVYLDDHNWPRTARAMILGVVSEIRPKEETALRVRITVTPRYRAESISRVTLKLEEESVSGRLGDAR